MSENTLLLTGMSEPTDVLPPKEADSKAGAPLKETDAGGRHARGLGRLDADAVDAIWTHTAARLGYQIVRTHEVYASTDGTGVLYIGARETLDENDSLAQLVFHELCHALTMGEANLHKPDWGMDNTTDADASNEKACLRMQAFLAYHHDLREAMRPTSVAQREYDELPADPLAGDDTSALRARQAVRSSLFARWAPALRRALEQTRVALRGNAPTFTELDAI